MGRLMDKIQETEAANNMVKRSDSVKKITTSKKSNKEKQISAKVNGEAYQLFTEINQAQGMSNNSVLNMLINKYVRENKNILEE